jgi:CRISPR-associated protein Cas2
MSEKRWHLISYDIREPKRWRKVYERIKGNAERVQYSVFRMYCTGTDLERLRFDLAKLMTNEDDLLIIHLCPGCARRVVDTAAAASWDEERKRVEIL